MKLRTQDIEQAIAENFYKELKIPDQRQVNAFKQYQKLIHYAFHMPELYNILEIGSGFSTVLFYICQELFFVRVSHPNKLKGRGVLFANSY